MYRIVELELRDAVARPLHLRQGCILRVLTGRVWLTQDRDSADLWLLPAQEWQAPASASVKLWLSGEPTASLQILNPIRKTDTSPLKPLFAIRLRSAPARPLESAA
ncbi:DUF2917 domain-containing protein [Roseateles koreensis]|uniref:DUF2917 domain-containing protein n=1 Tax=Roseateles koreensis TaxID=2987526 RepID=A0ABT5KX55_9BURK|nr:DUF2917 domain-containing protein [Roseateles koreensis]MDC8786411.1 DUF2917 domain-containing protein [Roseateles koreensis]